MRPYDRRRGGRSAGRRGWRWLWLPACALGLLACEKPERIEQVYGMQMHLHGSMSEGPGSMRGHDQAAARLHGAVDVLWWTDHDWRISGHTYVEEFDFEDRLVVVDRVPASLRSERWWGTFGVPGVRLPDPGEPPGLEELHKGWRRRAVQRPLRSASLRFSERHARTGRGSLAIEARGEGAEWEQLVLDFHATRRRHGASLASDVRLELALLPIALTGDARLVVRVLLSQQPTGYQGRLDYRISPAGSGRGGAPTPVGRRRVERPGLAHGLEVVTLELPHSPGRWNDLVLEVSRDAELHGLGGVDNALVELSLAVEARAGGHLLAHVDALRIERRSLGPGLFDEERRLARELEGAGPRTHHVGQEISYAAHLNAYGPDVPLLDSSAHPHGLAPDEAVAFAHAHGGIVSLNHIFGITTSSKPPDPEILARQVERIVAEGAFGADLLEVGYRSRGHDLDVYVAVWDALSAAGIFITGVGVSDSHDNELGWLTGPNNFITWVYAASASEHDLMAGLARGRAWFGDPTFFDGRLDIRSEGGRRMGQVLVGRGERELVFVAEGVRAGQSFRIVRDGEPIRRGLAPSRDFELTEIVDVQSPTFLRFEVRDLGKPIAFSNPLYLWPEAPEGGVPEARRGP